MSVAVLSGVTYVVCGSLTIFTGPVMRRFESRSVLVLCALFNSVGTFLFIGTASYYLMVIGRSLSGLSQAIICTYTPVWINEFAPRSH